MASLDETLALATQNNRVCPHPRRWNDLFELLPNKTQKTSGGWVPPLPVILAAWWDTPDFSKAQRLREHIEWASAHGSLNAVHSFLCALSEDEWHHVGE
jgi:hypothetical protein